MSESGAGVLQLDLTSERARFRIQTEEDFKDYAHRVAKSSLNPRDVLQKP